MKHLCQAGPTIGALIDPPRLLWSVYAYDPDGFARECPVGHNTNVTGYPFLEGTLALSFLSFLASLNPSPNNFLSKIQPIVLEHKELVWLERKLKLELIEYS